MSVPRPLVLVGALLLLAGGLATNGAAQGTPPGGAPAVQQDTGRPSIPSTIDSTPPEQLPVDRSVSGRIVRPGGERVVPVNGVWVVLHRVGADTAAPIDSTRSRSNGAFSFHYRAVGDPRAIYFVSTTFAGIAYFSTPLRRAVVTGDDAEITVFDTTSRPVPVTVRGRHIIISAPVADGQRDVVEVYELSNDSSVTFISADSAHPTWAALVPAGVSNFRVGQSDVSAEAVHLENGRVTLDAPLAPGIKQLSYAYRLPSTAFPLSIPVERPITVLEVLLEEAPARVEGAGLAARDSVSVEGRIFHRSLAQDVAPRSVVRVTVPAVLTSTRRTLYLEVIAVVIGGAMLVSLATSFMRRAPAQRAARARSGDAYDGRETRAASSEAIARAIAALDADFERRGTVADAEREGYRARRDALKRELAAALDAERSAT